MSTFYSSFHPAETAGAKGSAAFLGAISTAIVYLYKRSATAPAGPDGNVIYTFATGNINLSAVTNGWTSTIPAGTDPLYVVASSAVGTDPTDTIATGEWSSPVILAQNGEDGVIGSNGLNNAVVYIYKRDTSTPVVPSTTATYTFATGGITGLNNGWTATIPAGTDPLYVALATASSADATDTIASGEWTAPQILAQNGADGADGANGTSGLNVASVFLYKRSATAPATPTTTSTFTFATGVLTGQDNGWTQTIPAGTNPIYITTATASSLNATDTIPNTEWATPNILAQNGAAGANGSNGLNSATVFLYQRNDTGTPPSVPSVTSTYTFATGVLTGHNNGWQQTVPSSSSGKYLFVTTATAASTTATDTIASGEWAAPTTMAQDGEWGLTTYLTNDSFVVPANSSGVVQSYSGATGDFIIYNTESGTDVSSFFTLSTQSNPQTLTVNYVGNTYTVTAGLDAGENSAILIIRATGSGPYVGITIDKAFTLGKAVQGADGAAGAPGSNGINAISSYITNESTVVFTYADGTPVNFTNANGLMKFFTGITDVTASATGLSATGSGCTGTINTADNTPVNGQPKGYYRVTAMSTDTATLTLSGSYGGVSFTKVFALSKAKAGYEIVGSLPVTNLFQGRTVFLTTDNKLYRYTGTVWTTAVPTADLTGQITTTQITDDAVTTAKVAANAITATEIAAGTITAAKIAAGTITANEIAAGTITAAEIAANTITAAKLNISQLDAITATIGLLRTATTGARMEIENNVIRVYDTNGTLRVKIGNLA